jgi:small subunit ribosomal protein S5
MRNHQQSEYDEKVIRISRVSKKTKGGDQMGFTALMVVGDKKGKVGVGLGKAKDVVSAIRKGVRQAKKEMIEVPIQGTTIPFRVEAEHGAGKVLLKPAAKGSGVIAGGAVRAVVEAAGVKDISAKILGSDNQASSVHATMAALKKIAQIIKVRGIEVEQEKTEDKVLKTKPAKKKSRKQKAGKKIQNKTAKKSEKIKSIKTEKKADRSKKKLDTDEKKSDKKTKTKKTKTKKASK